jgi:hypothetical protein
VLGRREDGRDRHWVQALQAQIIDHSTVSEHVNGQNLGKLAECKSAKTSSC